MSKHRATYFAATCLVAIGVSVASIPTDARTPSSAIQNYPFGDSLYVNSKTDIFSYFEKTNYRWPIESTSTLPNVIIENIPHDLNTINDTHTKKVTFLQILLPVVLAEQRWIRNQRKNLALLLAADQLDEQVNIQIEDLYKEYKIKKDQPKQSKKNALLEKYDELPVTLVLAQAAIESGWGTSRFAREGNSLFGEWTFDGTGIIPNGRTSGKTHRIKAFNTLQNSVKSYMKNINSNNAYRDLRKARLKMRENSQSLDARILASGLDKYSEKGSAYVDSLLKVLNTKEFLSIEALKIEQNFS